jgi:hypothetical protein
MSQLETPSANSAETISKGLASAIIKIRIGMDSRLKLSMSFNLIDTSGGLTQIVATRRSQRSPSRLAARAREPHRPSQP